MAKRPKKKPAAAAEVAPKAPSAATSWARRLGLPSLGGAQIAQLGGVAMAVVVAVMINIVAARYYKRWDATSNKRYSLTPATVETLRGLGDAVHVWVLVGSSDPLSQSVKQILVAYQAETTKLDVHYVDPDRDLVALEDLRKRFKIETGRTEQGHVVTDAIMIVAHGERHWFLSPSDMVEVRDPNDPRVKPREEQAITGAIRNVLGGDKAALCFTSGHGEMALDDGSERGLAHLKVIVEKDNFAVRTVDTSAPNATEPFSGCSVVVVAGLRSAFTKDETERLRTYLLGGGNALLAVSPLPGATETGLVDVALGRMRIASDRNPAPLDRRRIETGRCRPISARRAVKCRDLDVYGAGVIVSVPNDNRMRAMRLARADIGLHPNVGSQSHEAVIARRSNT